jgi:RHS repeat-associated protein
VGFAPFHEVDSGFRYNPINKRCPVPSLNHWVQPDTIIPNPNNPQDWNRYSYVRGNPIKYNDPSGHVLEMPNSGTCVGSECKSGGEINYLYHAKHRPGNLGIQEGPGELPAPERNPDPRGNFIAGPLCSGEGGQLYANMTDVGLDSEDGKIVVTGSNVPLHYRASYDSTVFENLIILTLHEEYFIPHSAPPQLIDKTFGEANLVTDLNNWNTTVTPLGSFIPGNIAHSEEKRYRDTEIRYWRDDGVPVGLRIQIIFGADNLGADIIHYKFKDPLIFPSQ